MLPEQAPTPVPDSELAWRLRIDVCQRRTLGSADSRVLELWTASLVLEDEDDGDDLGRIGSANLIRCHLGIPGMVTMLDDEDVDLGAIGTAVLDHRTGEPAPGLQDLGGFGDRFLILDSVALDPAWRGRGIGKWFAAEVLETLSPGALFAVALASPLDDPEGDAVEGLGRRRAALKLRKTWAAIGFEQFAGNIMVLDLGLVTLGEKLAVIRSVFGA